MIEGIVLVKTSYQDYMGELVHITELSMTLKEACEVFYLPGRAANEVRMSLNYLGRDSLQLHGTFCVRSCPVDHPLYDLYLSTRSGILPAKQIVKPGRA